MARKNTHPHTHSALLLTISIVEGKKAISQKYGHLGLSASAAIVEWPLSFFQSQFHQNVNIRHFNLLVCFIIQSGKVSLNYVNNRENTVSDLAVFFFGEAEGRRRQDPMNGGPFSFQIENQFNSIHLKWNVEIERKKINPFRLSCHIERTDTHTQSGWKSLNCKLNESSTVESLKHLVFFWNCTRTSLTQHIPGGCGCALSIVIKLPYGHRCRRVPRHSSILVHIDFGLMYFSFHWSSEWILSWLAFSVAKRINEPELE